VIGMVAGAGIGIAWLGASVLVLADARRGLAVGLLLSAIGMALARSVEGSAVEGAVILGGGLLAAVACLRGNPLRGWGLLRPGSTPRVVLCVVLGGAALWLAVGFLDGPGDAQARAAAAIAMALGAGRLLAEREPRAALAAASLVALGAGAMASLATAAATGALIGAVAAVALNLLRAVPETELGSG
jgi:hypothetical protein